MTDFLNFLADDRYGWWWLFVLVPFLVLSWGWTASVRRRQLAAWNLSESATAPAMLAHVVLLTVLLGIVPLAGFSILNWLSQYMTWPQFGINFGCWLLGASTGITVGILDARARAERELSQFQSTSIRRQ